MTWHQGKFSSRPDAVKEKVQIVRTDTRAARADARYVLVAIYVPSETETSREAVSTMGKSANSED